MAEETNGRISVSRADLRADLAELKNDLKDYISEQLEKKADAKDIQPLITSVASLTDWRIRTERGEFTEAQKSRVDSWVLAEFRARSKESWSGWERKFAGIAAFVGLCGAAGGIAAAIEVFK